jgi:cell filamentation protein
VAVSVAGIRNDLEPARRPFLEILDPARVAALRKAIAFLKKSGRVPWNDIYISTTVAGQIYSGRLVGKAGNDFMMRIPGDPQDQIVIGASDDIGPENESGDEITINTTKF